MIGAEILVTEIGDIGVAFDSFCVYVCGRQIKPYFAVIAYDTNTSTDLTEQGAQVVSHLSLGERIHDHAACIDGTLHSNIPTLCK